MADLQNAKLTQVKLAHGQETTRKFPGYRLDWKRKKRVWKSKWQTILLLLLRKLNKIRSCNSPEIEFSLRESVCLRKILTDLTYAVIKYFDIYHLRAL